LVDIRDGSKRSILAEGRAQTPVANWKTDGVDPDTSKILKVGIVDEGIPMAFKNSPRRCSGTPARSHIELGDLLP